MWQANVDNASENTKSLATHVYSILEMVITL